MKISQLTSHLDAMLDIDNFRDYAPNGLQVQGKQDVKKLVTGVSCCQELIEKAVAVNADAILVHHGFFWRSEQPQLLGLKYARLKHLLNHDINLLAYHLPLDYHPEFGNNAELGKLLHITEPKFADKIMHGNLSEPQSLPGFVKFINTILKREPLIISAPQSGERKISSIAWCTGAAADYLEQAAGLGVDAFITGEINERSVYAARELGVHLIAAGHYATERGGVIALGKHLEAKFDLNVEFVELDNPV